MVAARARSWDRDLSRSERARVAPRKKSREPLAVKTPGLAGDSAGGLERPGLALGFAPRVQRGLAVGVRRPCRRHGRQRRGRRARAGSAASRHGPRLRACRRATRSDGMLIASGNQVSARGRSIVLSPRGRIALWDLAPSPLEGTHSPLGVVSDRPRHGARLWCQRIYGRVSQLDRLVVTRSALRTPYRCATRPRP